jgi:hypothetical protein
VSAAASILLMSAPASAPAAAEAPTWAVSSVAFPATQTPGTSVVPAGPEAKPCTLHIAGPSQEAVIEVDLRFRPGQACRPAIPTCSPNSAARNPVPYRPCGESVRGWVNRREPRVTRSPDARLARYPWKPRDLRNCLSKIRRGANRRIVLSWRAEPEG